VILQTTLSLSAAAAVINIWLSMRAGRVRFDNRISHGDGGNPMLLRRMRAHANFAEYTPFVLILIGVIEMTGKGGKWLAFVGAIYMLARVSHAFGMDREGGNPYRAAGFIVTMLTLLGLAIVAVLIALQLF